MAQPRIPHPPNVEAISKLNDLELLADQFTEHAGYAPELISHWNPKPSFASQIETGLDSTRRLAASLVDYVYSADITLDDRVRVLLRESVDRSSLLTPSGTTSVVNVCAYLKNIGIERLIVLTPTFFAVEAVAQTFGISVTYIAVRRVENSYRLPVQITDVNPKITATWLTVPVYCTSVYFTSADIGSFIDALPPEMIAVVDESLAYTDRPSLRDTKSSYRVLRICTPHKALCINGEKVSFVTFPTHLLENMDAWSDCFAGGIGAAGVRALGFLADDAYDRAVAKCRELSACSLSRLRRVLSLKQNIEIDRDTDGYFVMLYWPSLPASFGYDAEFLKKILAASGALPIPSLRNRHPAECGFCFRINLFRLDDAALGATSRLIDAINAYE
jgi:histidinol-phosphate/aromatic aminotransferase/cobyric acid decarboxylase-like protein